MTNQRWGEGERLIFIGGSPRSGTTLIQNILDSHPEIAGGPEFNLIRYFMKFHHDVDNFIELNTGDSKNTQKICTLSDFERELGIMIENLLLGYGIRKGKRF